MPGDMSWMKARYDELNEKSLLWEPPTLEGPNVPRCQMDGRPTIMLSANNYLNLTTHPKVVAAMQKHGHLRRWKRLGSCHRGNDGHPP